MHRFNVHFHQQTWVIWFLLNISNKKGVLVRSYTCWMPLLKPTSRNTWDSSFLHPLFLKALRPFCVSCVTWTPAPRELMEKASVTKSNQLTQIYLEKSGRPLKQHTCVCVAVCVLVDLGYDFGSRRSGGGGQSQSRKLGCGCALF